MHNNSSTDIGRVVIAKACPVKNILCFVHLACFITVGTYFHIYIVDKLESAAANGNIILQCESRYRREKSDKLKSLFVPATVKNRTNINVAVFKILQVMIQSVLIRKHVVKRKHCLFYALSGTLGNRCKCFCNIICSPDSYSLFAACDSNSTSSLLQIIF